MIGIIIHTQVHFKLISRGIMSPLTSETPIKEAHCQKCPGPNSVLMSFCVHLVCNEFPQQEICYSEEKRNKGKNVHKLDNPAKYREFQNFSLHSILSLVLKTIKGFFIRTNNHGVFRSSRNFSSMYTIFNQKVLYVNEMCFSDEERSSCRICCQSSFCFTLEVVRGGQYLHPIFEARGRCVPWVRFKVVRNSSDGALLTLEQISKLASKVVFVSGII